MSEIRDGLGVKRKAVETAILTMLGTNIKDVTWTRYFKGFQRGKGVVGSLVSDRIDFEYDAKNQCKATGRYVLIIADSENTDTVDGVADEAFDLLDNDDLNGTVTICEVKRISYAAAPTKSDAGAVLLELEVNYYV